MSAQLYSGLQSRKTGKLFITPFLASEIPRILESFPGLSLGYIGSSAVKDDPRLYAVEFSDTAATAQAAVLIASFCEKLPPGPVAVAVLLPEENLDGLSDAFLKGFGEAGGKGRPYILGVKQEFSEDAVSSLKNVDVRAAFIAVPGSAGNLYRRRLFSKDTYIVELQPIFLGRDDLVDIVLSWDFQRALDSIKIRMDSKKPGKERLAWKVSK